MAEEIGTLSVGTYDGIIYCYKFFKEKAEDSTSFTYYAKLLFNSQPHTGAVRSMAGSPRYLASGGYDGSIAIFDLHTMKNAGSLVIHEDSVEAIQFYQDSYLISGSADKTMVIWRTRDWAMMKRLAGHTASVTSLAISPTGKFMLSSGRDGSLRMWDLMHAHNAKTRKLGFSSPFIGFTDDSKQFYFGHDREVTIVDGPSEQLVFNFEFEQNVTAACLNNDILWVGTSNGSVTARNIKTGESHGTYQISDSRIKFIKVSGEYIFTMNSEGILKMGILHPDFEIDEIISKNLNARITCGEFIPSH